MAARRPPTRRQMPQLNVLAQYIKDFSFENPNAPRSLQPSQTQPAIKIQINVNAAPIAIGFRSRSEDRGQGGSRHHDAVRLRPTYGGVFRIQNVPEDRSIRC